MPAAQLVPNAPQPPVLPAPATAAAASTLKPGPVPAPAVRLATNPLNPGAVGSMMKPVTVHSTTSTLPGYNFPATSAVQQRLLLSPDMQARLPCEYKGRCRKWGGRQQVSAPSPPGN